MDKFKNVHPIFKSQLEIMYKGWPEEYLQDTEFCYYGHIVPQSITDPNDMRYWLPPDPWCVEWCGCWDRKSGRCGGCPMLE